MKSLFKLAGLAAACTLSFSAQALLIDDFSGPVQSITDNVTNGTGVGHQVAHLGAIGGYREIWVNKIAELAADPVLGVNMSVVAGALGFSQDAGQIGRGIIRYDGLSAGGDATGVAPSYTTSEAAYRATLNPVGLASQNLAAAGNQFQITVLSADAGFVFTLEIYSSAADWSSFTAIAGGPGVYGIPFAAFVVGGGAGASFASVGALQAILNNGGAPIADLDLRLDLVRVVPEPASLALVGGALLALGAMRRRKTAKK